MRAGFSTSPRKVARSTQRVAMKHFKLAVRFTILVVAGALGVASCFPEPSGMDTGLQSTGGSSPTMTADASQAGAEPGPVCVPRPKQDGAECHPAQSANPLAGRFVDSVPQDRTVF